MEQNKNEEVEKVEDVEEPKMSEETSLKDTVLLQKQQLDEQEDRLKRLMAEFDNFKKRSCKNILIKVFHKQSFFIVNYYELLNS